MPLSLTRFPLASPRRVALPSGSRIRWKDAPMPLLDLSFASGESSLSVRRVQVHEAISSLFTISVWARSPHFDLDLEALVGEPASLSIVSGKAHLLNQGSRLWSGVVASMEQVQGEPPSP